jgi:hypothetical protein
MGYAHEIIWEDQIWAIDCIWAPASAQRFKGCAR